MALDKVWVTGFNGAIGIMDFQGRPIGEETDFPFVGKVGGLQGAASPRTVMSGDTPSGIAGGGKSSDILLATHRFPFESKATPRTPIPALKESVFDGCNFCFRNEVDTSMRPKPLIRKRLDGNDAAAPKEAIA